MARFFELLEAGTSRLLGTVRTVDDVAPGALWHLLRDEATQVEAGAEHERPPELCGYDPSAARPFPPIKPLNFGGKRKR